jgi:hypothetical protein
MPEHQQSLGISALSAEMRNTLLCDLCASVVKEAFVTKPSALPF